jgi:hypothetical protein
VLGIVNGEIVKGTDQRRTWWPVLLVFNDTFNNVSGIAYNMVTRFIGV